MLDFSGFSGGGWPVSALGTDLEESPGGGWPVLVSGAERWPSCPALTRLNVSSLGGSPPSGELGRVTLTLPLDFYTLGSHAPIPDIGSI